MSKLFSSLFISLLLLLSSSAVRAENMIMLRMNQNFDTTMILLKEKLNDYGYKIAHIQKCDGGLTGFGYKTDAYKSVFFGKFEEMRHLTGTHPEMIPYLPLKIAVMQEKDTVVLAALNPLSLSHFFPAKDLQDQFGRWESDLRAIFEELAQSNEL
jgi:uncharacterized protein (DUF302 family)